MPNYLTRSLIESLFLNVLPPQVGLIIEATVGIYCHVKTDLVDNMTTVVGYNGVVVTTQVCIYIRILRLPT